LTSIRRIGVSARVIVCFVFFFRLRFFFSSDVVFSGLWLTDPSLLPASAAALLRFLCAGNVPQAF
jgi:hypothetical protein